MGADGRRIEGTVERFSGRTGKGSIRLVDGRTVRFSARKFSESEVRDLKPGDVVTVELREGPNGAVGAKISLRDKPSRVRDVRRRISATEREMADALERPLKILLVGRTGVGKSSTINTLLGVDWARVGDHEPETAAIHSYEGPIGVATVQVVDTPGFCDDHPDKGNDERYVRQIGKYIGEIDLMLFVTTLDDTRVRADEIRALELLTEAFGKEIWSKAVIAFTRADLLRGREYADKVSGRFAAFRKVVRRIASEAGSAPFIPVSNVKARTPDRRLWLPLLWIACLEQMSKEGFEPFFLSTAERLEAKSSRAAASRAARVAESMKDTVKEPGKRPAAGRSSSRLPRKGQAGSVLERGEKSSDESVPAPRAKALPRASQEQGQALLTPVAGGAPPPAGDGKRPVIRSESIAPAKEVPAVKPVPIVEAAAEPAPAPVDSTKRRSQDGFQIVESKLGATEARGTIVVTGDQAHIVQQLVERKAPSLLSRLAKIGARFLPQLKGIFGF